MTVNGIPHLTGDAARGPVAAFLDDIDAGRYTTVGDDPAFLDRFASWPLPAAALDRLARTHRLGAAAAAEFAVHWSLSGMDQASTLRWALDVRRVNPLAAVAAMVGVQRAWCVRHGIDVAAFVDAFDDPELAAAAIDVLTGLAAATSPGCVSPVTAVR